MAQCAHRVPVLCGQTGAPGAALQVICSASVLMIAGGSAPRAFVVQYRPPRGAYGPGCHSGLWNKNQSGQCATAHGACRNYAACSSTHRCPCRTSGTDVLENALKSQRLIPSLLPTHQGRRITEHSVCNFFVLLLRARHCTQPGKGSYPH